MFKAYKTILSIAYGFKQRCGKCIKTEKDPWSSEKMVSQREEDDRLKDSTKKVQLNLCFISLIKEKLKQIQQDVNIITLYAMDIECLT